MTREDYYWMAKHWWKFYLVAVGATFITMWAVQS